MSYSKIITGVLTGVVIGLLIAPDKGSETRKKVSKVMCDVSDRIEDLINQTRNEIDSLADEAVEHIENTEDSANKAFLT